MKAVLLYILTMHRGLKLLLQQLASFCKEKYNFITILFFRRAWVIKHLFFHPF